MTVNTSFIQDRQMLSSTFANVNESKELVDVLQKIVQNAGALLNVRNCSVALLDAASTSLVTMAALQDNGQKTRQTKFRVSEGVAGWVAEHCQPLVIDDVSGDPRFKRLGRTHVGSMLCVPLIDHGRFIGTITTSSQENHAFDKQKVQMLSIFAEQAVLAITNARHAELAQRQADQLEMLMRAPCGQGRVVGPVGAEREVGGVAWFEPTALGRIATDDSLRRAVDRARRALRGGSPWVR